MTKLKRRLLIGTVLIALILIGLVLFFYRPTRLALERAEAFQFRRMLVTRQADQDAYRFFFVTNRGLEKEEGPFEERFGNQREEDCRHPQAAGNGLDTAVRDQEIVATRRDEVARQPDEHEETREVAPHGS